MVRRSQGSQLSDSSFLGYTVCMWKARHKLSMRERLLHATENPGLERGRPAFSRRMKLACQQASCASLLVRFQVAVE